MKARIEYIGTDVLCHSKSSPEELRIEGVQAQARLEEWAARYGRAVKNSDQVELVAIGREVFGWLDENGWASGWVKATGPRSLEIRVDDPREPLAKALLDAPWELLANRNGYLAEDSIQLFEVARRIGTETDPVAPRYSDLHLMFMASAPQGASVLNFEAEEAAILNATERLPLQLVVEESGAAEFLGERLSLDGPFEALHLSCHGTIHPDRGPVLALENEFGDLDYVNAGQIVNALGPSDDPVPLVFLSACRTAEQAEGDSGRFEPFVRDLTRAGVANVLGWDGSVYDADASTFATVFYKELARHQEVPQAAAIARQELLRQHREEPSRGRHWHLARLYMGPAGGGALAARGQKKRKLAGAANEDQFLDKVRGEVPVASRSQFVGRRHQAQAVLKVFRDNTGAGVLIHGMGNLGKSSLAARIASRMTKHKTVVVFRTYDTLTVFDRVVEALAPQKRRQAKAAWREAILEDASVLAEALEDLLEGALDEDPVLLIVDDLEQILANPEQSDSPTAVQDRFRKCLASIITAFEKAQSASRLLLTSRYRFTLSDGRGGDLAKSLTAVPLQPMDEVERSKQFRAAEKTKERLPYDDPLVQRAIAAAAGNPGLQSVLTQPVLAGETEAAEGALAAIEYFQETGAPPEAIRQIIEEGSAKDESNAMVRFFKRMAFDTYRQALTEEQVKMLRAACLFSAGIPIPRSALIAAGDAAGVDDPSQALDRLLGLGLADNWGEMRGTPYASANPLARPLTAPLNEEEKSHLAASALPALADAWMDSDAPHSLDVRALEIIRLALAAPCPPPDVLNEAAISAAHFLFNLQHDALQAFRGVIQPAFAKLEELEKEPESDLLLVAYDCAERIGEKEEMDRILEKIEMIEKVGVEGGSLLRRRGSTLAREGKIEEAEKTFKEAAELFSEAGAEREQAIAQGQIADILFARGELDEALRIRTEEELPVFERLGDVRSKAVTQGQIADILFARGDLDEALRIRTEEQLPVYERLGDVRSKAVTQGKIADILFARGELDEALRIRTEEQLPVYERLGDVREKAVTQGKIADILMARGELDEALRIRTEEELPVYERLGNVREKAVTQGEIADILMTLGQLDEALLLHEQRLASAQKAGLVDAIAHTKFSMASIRLQREEHKSGGIQRIYEDLAESFAINQKLGRPDGIAMVGRLLGQILAMGGQPADGLKVLDLAADAFGKMGREKDQVQVRELQEAIKAQKPPKKR